MAVAVQPQHGGFAGAFVTGVHGVEQGFGQAFEVAFQVGRQPAVFQQVVHRVLAVAFDADHAAVGESPGGADRMQAAQHAAQVGEHVAVAGLGRMAAAQFEQREAMALEVVKRAALDFQRRDNGKIGSL